MIIDLATDFSLRPFGRTSDDGPDSGARFRDEVLAPALRSGAAVEVRLDGVLRGIPSSFLEEAFGGLIRNGFTKEQLSNSLLIRTGFKDYLLEIEQYIEEESRNATGGKR